MLVPASATIAPVERWEKGVAASLRAALAAVALTLAEALLVIPVDLPDLPVSACRRVMDGARRSDLRRSALRRAVYGGNPGHPALLGRDHWAEIASDLHGDRGAGAYLAAMGAERVECGDLWHGSDVDVRAAFPGR